MQLKQLFDRLVRYRNEEVGHGAAGQRPRDFYDRMGFALLAGVAEVWGKLDVLVGRQLIHIANVRGLTSGAWLVDCYELCGEAPHRRDSLELPASEAARLPRPGRFYLHDPATGDGAWRALHPLLVYDAETGRLFLLNARRQEVKADYLCSATGDVVRIELGPELLARVLGSPVNSAAVADRRLKSRD